MASRQADRRCRSHSRQPEKPTPEPLEIGLHAGQEQQERQPHECQNLDGKVGFHPAQLNASDAS